MKRIKINNIFVFVLVMMFFIVTNIYAASIDGNSSVNEGDTFTLTLDFGYNVGGYNSLDVKYDNSIIEYVSGDSIHEDVWWDSTYESLGIRKKTYTFKAKKAGSTKVTIKANYVVNSDTLEEQESLLVEKLINVAAKKEEKPVNKPQENNNQGNVTNKPTDSGNNYLKYLQISEEGLSPNFTRNVTEYSLAVGENVNSIEVLARAEDTNARVVVTGHDSLKEGDNKIQIKVTAQNGYYRVYTITVTKSQDKEKSNAYLENLIIENFNLDKVFQSEVLEYSIGEISSTVKNLNVIANAKDSNAKIEVIGKDALSPSGEGKIIVKVTAQDGTTIKEYEINYTVKEATDDEIASKEMKDYLKDIQNSNSKKEIAISYLKYAWIAIKKNYLLVLMYLLILIEFIQIVILRRKIKKMSNTTPPDDNPPPEEKEILRVEKEDDTPKENIKIEESVNIEPPKVELLDAPVFDDNEVQKSVRRGSLEKNTTKAEGIKLVDLDKNEGPQDELTFNIFDNLTDEDIKRMLEDQIDDE